MGAGELFFQRRYHRLCGEYVKRFPLKKCIRVNTLKIEPDEIVKRLNAKGVELTPLEFSPNGFRVERSKFSLGATPEYLQGFYYLQSAAAQRAVVALDPQPGEYILDMCAAPGGKTTQIAQRMENSGILVATDVNEQRLSTLYYHLQRMGVGNALVYALDGLNIGQLDMRFDRILLDAPCSGNCITDQQWFARRDLKGIQKCAELQKRLLSAAVSVLKSSGTLVYSTCSLEPEENELVIDWALKNLPVALQPITQDIGEPGYSEVFGTHLENMEHTRRIWPHKTRTEGFFVAKLQRT